MVSFDREDGNMVTLSGNVFFEEENCNLDLEMLLLDASSFIDSVLCTILTLECKVLKSGFQGNGSKVTGMFQGGLTF